MPAEHKRGGKFRIFPKQVRPHSRKRGHIPQINHSILAVVPTG